MNRLKRSWSLFKNSFAVLWNNKKLFIFPVLTTFSFIVIVLFYFAAVFNISIVEKETPLGCSFEATIGTEFMPILFLLYYLMAMFLATFFNVAFYSEIIHALNGGEVSIMRGINVARSKIFQILAWSFVAGLVGCIIGELENIFGFIGKITIGLIGITWSVASVFVIPVIIRENTGVNPLNLLKKSGAALKRTWGEAVIGYTGIYLIGLAFFLVFILLFFGNVAIFSPLMHFLGPVLGYVPAMRVMIIITTIIMVIGIAFLITYSIAEGIYTCALYIYATEGVIPEHFSQEDMDSAWKINKKT